MVKVSPLFFQFPARTKLSTDHIVSSPSEAHPYLREDLPVVGPEKAIKVTDISPLLKHKNKSAMKAGRKADRSEEITGSPYKAALEIKDALKSKGKAHANKALSLGKSPKTQRRNNVPENPSRDDDDETFCICCNHKYGLRRRDWIMSQECKLWAHEDY
jgi:hypothetical protein